MTKLAISNIAWLPEENDAVAELLGRHSVRGVEVAPSLLFDDPAKQSPSRAREARDYWNDRGINIVAMQALLFGHPELVIFGSESVRHDTLEYLKRMVELGGRLGAHVLVFGSPKNRQAGGMETGKALEIAAGFFGELGRAAADSGTCFCIEPNARDYGCDFVTNTREAVELVERVSHPGFGLHVDLGVITMNGESVGEAIAASLPHMRHFHISEPYLGKITDSKSDHGLAGRLLKDAGYEGWVSIEMKKDLGESNIKCVDDCLAFAARKYTVA